MKTWKFLTASQEKMNKEIARRNRGTSTMPDSNEARSVMFSLTRKEAQLIENRGRPPDMSDADWALQLQIDQRRLLRAVWSMRVVIGNLVGIARDVEDINHIEAAAVTEAKRHLR